MNLARSGAQTRGARTYGPLEFIRRRLMRPALFWVITQRVVVILYRRFGTTYRSHLQGKDSSDFLTLEDGTDILLRNVVKELPLLAA